MTNLEAQKEVSLCGAIRQRIKGILIQHLLIATTEVPARRKATVIVVTMAPGNQQKMEEEATMVPQIVVARTQRLAALAEDQEVLDLVDAPIEARVSIVGLAKAPIHLALLHENVGQWCEFGPPNLFLYLSSLSSD